MEQIRDLRFRRVPRGRVVTPADATRSGLADLDRSYPITRQRADQALLVRLGALPPSIDLRREIASVFRDQVGGFYDPRTKALAVVSGSSRGGTLGEITLAHELNHALEDQRFGLKDEGAQKAIDDASLANSALVEGTATAVMFAYAQRFLDPGNAIGDLLPAALQSAESSKLPRYLQDSLIFPYEAGQAFVNRLYTRLHSWALVDYALGRRRPASTEQILHPEKYLADERPLPVRVPGARVLGPGWRPFDAGTLGEFDTRELLRLAGARDANATAAGWGGGSYALWRRGRQTALALSWRWDTQRDADQAAAALPAYARFAGHGAATTLRTRDTATALAIAPTPPLAARLAGASVSPGR